MVTPHTVLGAALGLLLALSAACQEPCVSQHDCPGDQWCVDAVCRSSCGSEFDCPEGWRCAEGRCERHLDQDEDGFSPLDGDCDDSDPRRSPGLSEIPYDGIDNDCSPTTADDDVDFDGYALDEDCDDLDPHVSPGAQEIPFDEIDNDCRPETSDLDGDGDGAEVDVDCDDTDARRFPSADERCEDGVDQDCDGADLRCGAGTYCDRVFGVCRLDSSCGQGGASGGACPTGQVCDAQTGICEVDASCAHGGAVDGVCPAGQRCSVLLGVCEVDPTCDLGGATAGVCPAGQDCDVTTGMCGVDASCDHGGAVDGVCPTGQACDAATGLCLVDPTCDHGGAGHGICPAGQACDPASGLCEVDATCAHGGATAGRCQTDFECVVEIGLCVSIYDLDNDGDGVTENAGDCDDGDAAVNPAAAELCGDNLDNDCVAGDSFCTPPSGTACMGAICVARYESSRADADASQAGSDDASPPRFVAGVKPWTDVTWGEAQQACAQLGMRLCAVGEWQTACAGVDAGAARAFSYGADYLPGACNTESFGVTSTGAFTSCESPEGVFDLNGNVAELVGEEAATAATIGGDFSTGVLASCDATTAVEATLGHPAVGFRCCIAPDDDHDADGWNAASDCDDTDAAVNPDAVEVCNAIDDNCDGRVDDGFDGDGDGWPSCYDCNDNVAAIHPCQDDAPGDGIDRDCDGADDTATSMYTAGRSCFASCTELAQAQAVAEDGVNWLDPDGDGDGAPFRAYCHDMANTPTDYLQLEHTGGGRNYAIYYHDTWAGTWIASCDWDRVRITDLQTMAIDGADKTFATCTGDPANLEALSWGSAGSCRCFECPDGFMNIDLGGTSLRVALDAGVDWIALGSGATGAVTRSEQDGVIVEAIGGGFCGAFSPAVPPGLRLSFLP